jgi:hypothetical protein
MIRFRETRLVKGRYTTARLDCIDRTEMARRIV